MKQGLIPRRRGVVGRLFVELDASQLNRFNTVIKELGLKKTDAIAAAINVWLNMVEPRDGVR